jgi:hypothetical protein
MARKVVTAADEAQLIADAEASRDDPNVVPVASGVTIAKDASAVLSVRLQMDALRTLRELAKARRMSLSELLQDAVDSLLGSPAPHVDVSESASRFIAMTSVGGVNVRTMGAVAASRPEGRGSITASVMV